MEIRGTLITEHSFIRLKISLLQTTRSMLQLMGVFFILMMGVPTGAISFRSPPYLETTFSDSRRTMTHCMLVLQVACIIPLITHSRGHRFPKQDYVLDIVSVTLS